MSGGGEKRDSVSAMVWSWGAGGQKASKEWGVGAVGSKTAGEPKRRDV
jgi:hypothetical protein